MEPTTYQTILVEKKTAHWNGAGPPIKPSWLKRSLLIKAIMNQDFYWLTSGLASATRTTFVYNFDYTWHTLFCSKVGRPWPTLPSYPVLVPMKFKRESKPTVYARNLFLAALGQPIQWKPEPWFPVRILFWSFSPNNPEKTLPLIMLPWWWQVAKIFCI